MKVGFCEICGDYSKLGFMACVGRNLCPWCTAQILGVSEKEARKVLDEEVETMYAEVVSKVSE